MLSHQDLIAEAMGIAVALLFVRYLLCLAPYKLSRILPWRLSRPAVVAWRDRPFLGWSRGWLGWPRFAFGTREDSVIVVGPPRVGKTAGVLIPQLAMWDGPAVATSTKNDVLLATAGRRAELARLLGGSVYVYAPTEGDSVEGLTPIRWSPLAGCQDPRIANLRVEALVSVAQVGKNVENADHWRAGAGQILRPYFWAAAVHPKRPGDFALVREWLAAQEFQEPLSILTGLGTSDAALWARDLLGVMQMKADRERDSFFSAARTAVKAMSDPTVLRSARGTDIDPFEFLRTRSTLYIVSPTEHQEVVAPLIAALVESIVQAAYQLHRTQPRRRGDLGRLLATALSGIVGRPAPAGDDGPPRLLLSLDELANIAPLPSLLRIVSQGASQGVLAAIGLQSLAQLSERYGDRAADAIWSATRCKVVFGGLADAHSLDQVSKMIGDHRVPTRTVSHGRDGGRQETRSYEWRPRVSPAELRGLRPKWALLLYHHRPPYALRAPVAERKRRMRRAFVPWSEAVASAMPAIQAVMAAEPAMWPELRPRVVRSGQPPAAASESNGAAGAEVEG